MWELAITLNLDNICVTCVCVFVCVCVCVSESVMCVCVYVVAWGSNIQHSITSVKREEGRR